MLRVLWLEPGGTVEGGPPAPWEEASCTARAETLAQADLLRAEFLPDILIVDQAVPGAVDWAATRPDPLLPVIIYPAERAAALPATALPAGDPRWIDLPAETAPNEIWAHLTTLVAQARAERDRLRVVAAWNAVEGAFVFESDPALISPLVAYCEAELRAAGSWQDDDIRRIAVVLREALDNAIYHGNLELDSGLREDDVDAYCRLSEERRQEPPYAGRRVFFRAVLEPERAVYRIRDEGPGFNPQQAPNPRNLQNLEREGGRGLALMRCFMDDVRYNEQGTEVMVIKHRSLLAEPVPQE